MSECQSDRILLWILGSNAIFDRKMMRRSVGYRTPLRRPKQIPASMIIGRQGVNLIESIVLSMGFVWHPTGGVEAGIDGFIELRDPTTGVMLNSLIPVQSKATTARFANETTDEFDYTCDERDLVYWLQGNANLILVVCRPTTKEAYWVSVKDYFKERERSTGRRIHFDKTKHKFDQRSASDLVRLGTSKDAGIYLAPAPRIETLYTNLLEVTSLPERIFAADTNCLDPRDLWAQLRKLGGDYGPEWLLKDKRLWSFRDLSQFPWSQLCEVGTLDELEIIEWSESDVPQSRRDLVRLLNQCLQAKLTERLGYFRPQECFYFPASPNLKQVRHRYERGGRYSIITVFQGYPSQKDPSRMAYYRHAAFQHRFQRYDNKWFLEISPTYHFTRDGNRPALYYAERLSGIKRIERPPRILAQVLMWADLMSQPPSLLDQTYPYLTFGQLATVEVAAGIDDDSWLGQEDPSEADMLRQDVRQLPLVERE